MSRSTLLLMPAPKDMTAEAELAALKAELDAHVREALKKLMEELYRKHGKQGAVARAIGLPQSEVSKMKRGGLIPGVDKIVLIAAKLGRSTDSILDLKTPELKHARDLYEVLKKQFEHESETQQEVERASARLRPPEIPAPDSHTEPGTRTNRRRTIR